MVEKDKLRGGYNSFLRTESGKDLLKQFEVLEKSYVLKAIKGETAEAKAFAVSNLEGLVEIRDYILRMSKPKK